MTGPKAKSTAKGAPKPEPAVLEVESAAAWEAWLEDHHATTDEGVWLRLPNKGAPKPGPSYVDAVEVALCFGWIDGQVRKDGDPHSRLQRFTPRRARSVWSKVNVGRVERLVAEGRMRPEGLAEVERARADGRWDGAYDPPSTAVIPEDFLAALAERPEAAAFFATLGRSETFPIAFRLQTARTPATRARRIGALLDQLARGEKFTT